MSPPNTSSAELLLPLEASGSGDQWLARETSSKQLRLLLVERLPERFAGQDDWTERLAAEARTAAALRHKRIVETVAAGPVDGAFSLLHAFPPGDSLEALVRHNRPPLPVTLRLLADITEGLAAAHQNDQIHGAISPAVIHLDCEGSARLARFGTARIVRRVRHNWGELNAHQLSYLAPEHCMNDPLDRRTDIFNLGTLLWELLTGRSLFEKEDEFERMRAICEEQPPPPTRFNDDIPPLLNSLTLKALSIEPEDRFGDAVDLGRALEGILNRSQEAASHRDVAGWLSETSRRYESWQRLERARRQEDLPEVVQAVATLYDVDPGRAQLGEAGAASTEPSPASTVTEEEPPPTVDSPEPEADLFDAPTAEAEASAEELFDDWSDDSWADDGLAEESVEEVSVDESSGDEDFPTFEETDDETVGAQRSAQQLLEESEPLPEADETPTREVERAGQVAPPPETDEFGDDALGDTAVAGDDFDEELADTAVSQDTPDPPDEVEPPRPDEPIDAAAGADASPSESSEDPDAIGEGLGSISIEAWLDEDEDDPEDFREPFSLDEVLDDRPGGDQASDSEEHSRKPAVEVVRIAGGKPLDVHTLHGKKTFEIDGVPVRVTGGTSRANVSYEPPTSGWLVREDEPGQRKRLPDAPSAVELRPGDVCQVTDGEVTYRVRSFYPPASPDHIRRANVGKVAGLYAGALLLAAILHGLAAFGVLTLHSSFGVAMSVQDKPKKEVFAEGKLEKPEEEEQEEPKDQPEPPAPPKPVDPTEQEAKVPESVQNEITEQLEKKRQASKGKSEAEAMAAALQAPSDGNKGSVKEAVSNIDAVDSPSGSSDVEIGGSLEGIKGNDVQINSGGSGDGESKLGNIGSQLGEGTGKLAKREGSGGGKVRGQVSSPPSETKVEGRLARSKVSKVINQHQGQIQGCYEKQLLTNAGLSGKVTFEWTITRSGRVSGVRQKTSSLGSPAVSNCIIGILRKLTFPKPKGGSVSITYPFVFRSGG